MAMADGPLSSLTQRVERLESWIRSSVNGSSLSSPWVPSLQHHLKRLCRILPRIQAVLTDAEEMEIQDESVKLWLREIKDVWYDADDVLDEYEYELLRSKLDAALQESSQAARHHPPRGDLEQVSNLRILSSMGTSFWVQMVSRIEEITERFNEISQQRDHLHLREGVGKRRSKSTTVRPPSTPLVDGPNKIYGRDADTKGLMSRTFSPGDYNPSVIAVVGMGGVGKTTLVQHVYNDQAVSEHFQLRGWVCVSDDFDVITLTKRIIEAITKERCDLNELSPIQEKLVKLLSGKRFLLVLDDLWNQRSDLWFCLRAALLYGLQGSTIITTTRNEKVARLTQTMPSLHIGCLQFDDCWAIFQQFAFPGGQVPNKNQDLFLEVGKQIVTKCKGLPLASRTLGGLLRCESDIDRWNEISRSEIWDLDEDSRNNILPTLMLSYIHLPTHLKRCFVYCAVFPQDHSFTEAQLVRLWMAQGLIQSHRLWQLEERGSQYFDELLQRSFFQPSHEYSPEHEQRFVMHDLIHDLAVSVSGGECSAIKNQETWRPSYESQSLRHIAFVPGSSDVTMLFQSLCCGELSGLRSLLLATRPDVWVKKEVVNEIPDIAVQTLVSLRALDLGYVRLQHLPDSIGNLKHLRYLDLSRTRIEVFPESICHLYLLQTLDLSYARITGLSDSISNLTELRYVNLCNSSVRMLPEAVGELINLRTLDLAYTGISNLPQSVGNLRHLTFIDLSGTLINIFPESVTLLCNLRTLNLNNVPIDKLPDSIGNLQKLLHLHLNETGIKTLPESICKLRLLQVLNLSFSRLKRLPESIGNLRCLSHLDLSSTRIRRLPKSICSAHNLQSLLLKGSYISSLPEEMGSLTNLQHLDFSSERVYRPSGIGGLTNLRTLPALNLGKHHVGSSIEDLNHLTELRGSLQISGLKFVNQSEHVDMAGLRAKTQIDKLTLDWSSIRSWDEETRSPSSEEGASDTEQSDLPDHPLSSEEFSASDHDLTDLIGSVPFGRIGADHRSLNLSVSHPNRTDSHRFLRKFARFSRIRPFFMRSGANHKKIDLERIGDAANLALDTEQSGLLERLQPHSGLKVLQVLGYGGRTFPRWMADPSFSRLVQLVLQGCTECSCLPALGQLPSLKQLTIAGASSVERIGPEFRFSDGGDQGRRGAFPSLEDMRIQHMAKWVKWKGVQNGDFPQLAWLEIEDCPALRGDLPFSTTCSLPMLKVLKIRDCPSLVSVFLLNVPNLGSAEFERCEQLADIGFGNLISSSSAAASPSSSSSSSSSSWPPTTTSTEMKLRFLRITGCPQARFSQGQGHLLPRTLAYLYINSQCGCLLDWCLGDGNEWLSQIPYTAVRGEGGGKIVLTSR